MGIDKILLTSSIVTLATLFGPQAKADIITLNIEGEGSVSAAEASITCNESCVIENDLAKNTLIASPTENWQFTGWTGQQCDSGNEVFINEQSSRLSAVSGGAKTLRSADINGDGAEDLAAISLFDGTVITLINDGSGAFTKKTVEEGLSYPSSLDFYDWDSDGDDDLIVSVYGQSKLKLYSNDGNGDFSFNRDLLLEGTKPYAIAITDLNNDQQADLIVSSFSADISGDLFQLVTSIKSPKTSLFTLQDGEFVLEKTLSENAAITLDVSKSVDSNEFLVIAAEIVTGETVLYKTDESSTTRTVVDTRPASYGAAFGDIDNNGTVDILAAYYRPSVLGLYYNKGDNTFTDMQAITKPSEGVTATVIADLNSDGYQDVATGEFNNQRFYYFATNSYKDCIVKQGSDISLTAQFAQTSNPTPPSTPAPEEDSSSGGGALSWYSLLCALIVALGLTHSRQSRVQRKS
ncbi:FG-GAP repeat domain-containing protein [Shewanella woodyi]|uniref:FG-GAP repeat protein n=1 Tax=Shewanella woodyi (strain ATCC 51908 / MS32) TaxID=392500 RepID=B1KPX0_SHEWM|nr:VCBS repeat-containing protein [Shewanella woodyi]ACA87653.1 FG-GAP repeat protein [Shewanella woodyi ATCC 51908]